MGKGFLARFFGPAALGLGLVLAGSSPTAQEPQQTPLLESETIGFSQNFAQPGHTYWRDEKTGTIIDVWKCAETRLCLKAHFIDADDKDMQDWAVWGLEIDRRPADPRKVKKDQRYYEREDAYRFCGFGPRFFEMEQQPADPGDGSIGKWKGKFRISLDRVRGQGSQEGKTFGVEIEDRASVLVMRGWWDSNIPFVSLVKKEFKFSPVAAPPPSCAAPALTPLR